MHVVIICEDKPDSLQLRLDTRPAHLHYLKAQGDTVAIAGPLLDDAEQSIGSLYVVDVPDLDAARAFLAGDPFTNAGLFASTQLRPWRWGINPPAPKS